MAFGDTIVEAVLGKVSVPEDTDNTPNTIAEGAAVNTTVGITAHSTFANGNAGLDYSLSADSSGGGFKIDQNTGVVTVADPSKIDFESAPIIDGVHTYLITVLATKNNNFSAEQTFKITVNDVAPSAPVDSNAAANTVLEGAANGTAVGITASSTDANGGAVTYSLTGDSSGGGFTINATTGVVTVADGSKIDFESAPGHAYTITVQSSDGTLTSSQAFTVNVGDVSMTTPVDSNAGTNSVAEGAAAGTTVGITASATDPSGPAPTYSLIGDTSGGGFAINAATGVVTVANPAKIDFESSAPGHTYNITVQASNGVQTTAQVFSIGVTDVAPSAPVDSNGALNTVAEGAANGTVVGITASSSDVNGPAVTYSLTGDTSGGGFTINSTTGVITVADGTKINYETAPGHAYTVTAQASDGTLTNSQTFTIAVTDVAPTAPTDSNIATNTVAEGAANGSTVGVTAFSTDINGPGVTYSLVGDTSGGGFTINSTTGVVTVADGTKLDYETTPSHNYTITAQASDGTLTNSQTFIIALTDVAPTAPTDINSAANTVAEGAANGSTVGITASSVDPNGPATTYALSDSAGGRFAINSSTGVVTVANGAAIDFETAPGAGHTYGITVQATNGALTTSSAFSIGVTDVAPSAPTDTNVAGNSVLEGAANGTAVGITASSTDPGTGPTATYALTNSAGGRFTIDANSGVVTVANGAAIDFETAPGHAYGITVQATAGALSSTQNFTIGVTDVAPSAPMDNDGGTNTVAEGAANGSAVGVTAFSTDINGGALTYSLVGDSSGGGFAINSTTGVITVADGTKLDYETGPAGHAYTVTAQASDGTLTNSQTFAIALTDVAPTAPTDANNATNTVAEGAVNGTIVGITASSADPNGPAPTYSLTDNAGGRFAIDSSTGVVTVANGAAIDFETAAGHAYGITVQATSGALSTTSAFSIGVTDVAPSAPTDTNVATNSVFEMAANGTAVGITASSTDPGGGPAPTYTLTDNAGGRFAIDAGGNVTVANGAAIDYETAPGVNHSYSITVQSTAGALSSTQNFSILVGDVDEAPQGTDKTVTMLEGDSYTFSVADFGFSDPSDSVNPNSLLAVKMTTVPGAGTGTFTDHGVTVNTGDVVSATDIANGLLVFTPAAHSNGAPEASFTFQVQDNGGTANNGVDLDQSANTVSINVNAVNDAPVNSVPGAQSVNEEATLTFSSGTGNAITISDIDVGSGNETVTLTVGHGTLALGSHAGLVSFGPDNAASITLTGTIANIDNALNGLTYTGNLDFQGVDTLTVHTDDNGNTGAGGPKFDDDGITITVNDLADTPSVTNATTNEDTQSTSGLVVSRNAADSAAVAFFKVTGITHGTLFQNDGVTAINNGDFITFAQANAGLKFTPAADFDGNGSFSVQASTSNADAGLGGGLATATITVDPVADTPSVTNATTSEDTQSASGLVVSRAAVDGAEVGFFKITGIDHGTLFQHDGTTAINDGDFITFAEANAGLKFTPAADFFGNGTFNVQASTSNADAGLGGSAVTATIAVSAVADTPSVTNATTNEDTQSATGLVVTHNPVDGAEVGFVKVTGITNGALFQNDGTTAINNGDFITYAQANAGLKFTPAADFFGNGSFDVQASTTNADAGLGGSVQTATITVDPVNDAPALTATGTNPNYIGSPVDLFSAVTASTGPANESTQLLSKLVLTVTNISGTANDFLTIDGTQVNLTDLNDLTTGGPLGVHASVSLAGSTATVTLTSTAGLSDAGVQSLVDGLSYTDVTAPDTLARVVTLTSLQDNGGTSPGVDTTTLAITSTVSFDAAPTITGGATISYVENAAATQVDNTIVVNDTDDTNLESATVKITSGFASGQDVLAANTAGTSIVASFSGDTLTLTGHDTLANYQAVLRSVTYRNTSDDPSGTDRVLTTTVNDGTLDSTSITSTIHVAPVNDEPTLTATGLGPTFTENGSPVALFSGASASTVEAGQSLDQIVLTVTNVAGTGTTESLLIDGTTVALSAHSEVTATNGLTASVSLAGGTATVTLSSAGGISAAALQTLVNALAYGNSSDDPGAASRVVTITSLRDTGPNGGPNNDDNIHTGLGVQSTVTVTPVNDEPTLTGVTSLNPGFTENGAAVTLFSGGTASAVEAGQNLNNLVVTVSNVAGTGTTESLFIDGTTVALNTHSVTTATNGMTADVTLSGGTATVTISHALGVPAATIQGIIDGLAYGNTSENPGAATRVVTITSLSDTGSNVAPNDNIAAFNFHSDVAVTPVNDAPVVTFGATTAFSEPANGTPAANSVPVTIAPGLTITDVDSANLTQATFVLNNLKPSDALSISGQAGASGDIGGIHFAITSTATTETVTLTGPDTVANYNAVLDAVQFNNTSENPDQTARSYTVTAVDDGTGTNTGSASATETVTAINDAPVNTVPAEQDTIFSRTATAITGLSVSDVDSGAGETTVLSVVHGTLNVASIGGAAVVTNNGTASVTLTGTAEQIATTLSATNGVLYTSAAYTGPDTLTVTTNDNGATGTGAHPNVVSTENLGIIPKVWFIDNSATGAQDGSQAHPFQSLAAFNAVNDGGAGHPQTNDYIYLKTGTGTYSETDGIHLLNGQQLVGGGDGLTFPDPLHAGTLTIETAGTRPVIDVTGGAGNDAIHLAQDNTIHGFNVATENAAATGIVDNGGTVGTLNISNMDVGVDPDGAGALHGNLGQAISITHGGTGGSMTFGTVSSGGGAGGIALGGALVTSFSATGGSLSGHTGSEFSSSGGSGNVNYGGAIGDGSGTTSVSITGRTGGTVTLGGNITDGSDVNGGIGISGNSGTTINFNGTSKALNTGIGDGVSITNNTGSTVNFNNGGLAIQTTNGTAFQDTVAGTLNVTGAGNTLSTTGTGTALNLNGITVGANGVTFDTASTTGATNGIVIDTVTGGAINVNGGSIAGTTNRGVDINAVQNNISIASSIGSTGGHSVEVTNSGKAGGNTISFSGAVTDSGGGINLDNNDQNGGGTTVNFSGGLNIDTTTSTGFNATNGGTVNVTNGANNSISSTSATALNVANTTIGSSNITFHDISSGNNTAAADPVNGIVLNTTGTSGHLVVTGSGGATNDGSGGTIQHTSGDGVNLTSTQDVTLGYMNITNNLGDGIGGSGINGLVLNHLIISGNGDNPATDESGINLTELTGSASNGAHPTSISNSNINNNEEFEIQVSNTTGTLTNLQLINNTLAANGLAINGNASSPHGSLVNFLGLGTSVMGLTVTGGSFTGNTVSDATHIITGTGVFANSGGTSMTANVSGATFTNNNAGVDVSTDPVATSLSFDIENNNFQGTRSTAINQFDNGNGPFNRTVNGTIKGNTIGTDAVTNSGSAVGTGIDIQNEGAVNGKFLIDNNTISQIGGAGNAITVNVGLGGATTGGGETDVTITNNTIQHVNGSRGLTVNDNQDPAFGPFPTIWANIHGNTFANIAGQAGNGQFLRIKELAGTVKVTQDAPTAANTATELDNANNSTDPTKFNISGTVLFNQGAAPLPTTNPLPLNAAAGGVQSSGTPSATHDLTQAELNSVVVAAIGQWALAGASAAQLAALHSVIFNVDDLSGNTIGDQGPGAIITIDKDAAGHGWFVDPTPNDNSEFTHAQNAAGTDLLTDPSNDAAGHLDLLTTVTHELGHVLGLDDSTAASDVHDLMYIDLVDGERRLPDATDVAQANAPDAMRAELALPVSAQAATGTPIVTGTAANDTIDAGHGGNILFGGAGADHFVFGPSIQLNAPTPAQVTHVADYHAAEGDTFDFSAITSAFHNSSVNDSLVVRAVEDASGKFATLQVDHIDPMGLPSAPNWVNVAQLDGAHSGDAVNILIDNNHSVHLAQIHVDLLV